MGDGELVVPRRWPSPLLDVGKRPLDDIAVPIRGGAERQRPSTFADAFLFSRVPASLLCDHSADSTRTQVFKVATGPISAVSQNGARVCASLPTTSTWHSDIRQGLRHYHPVATPPANDHSRRRSTLTVDGMVDLRRQLTARATDAVSGRFTRLIGLILANSVYQPPVSWSGRVVLVTRWWVRLPVPSTEMFQAMSAAAAFPYGLPGSEALAWQVAPGNAVPVSVDGSFDHSTGTLKCSVSFADVRGQQWFHCLQLPISQFTVWLFCRHEPTGSILETPT